MSKIRSSNIEILISEQKADSLETPPVGLVSLECDATSFGWDFGTAEEIDTTPLCEKEARRTEYGLKGKGSITFDMFFDPKSEAYKSMIASNTDLATRYIKVVYKGTDGTVEYTREVLGTVESINETANVGEYVNASITIGTSGSVKKTDGPVSGGP